MMDAPADCGNAWCWAIRYHEGTGADHEIQEGVGMLTREELQKGLKPIADGLFGKQRSSGFVLPKVEMVPLAEMLRDLTVLKPSDWCGYVFSREPLNGKLTDPQRQKWMKEALACGREYAAMMRDKYGVSEPERLGTAMGMHIEYPDFPEKTDRVLFAEFREPSNIRIYMDAVNKANQLLEEPEIREIMTDSLRVADLLLAHELFHMVEETYRTQIYTRQEKIRLWSLGPLHNDSCIIALSEIGAMGFAWELTGIPYAPWVMDVFLVYGYSSQEAAALYHEIMSLAGKGKERNKDEYQNSI